MPVGVPDQNVATAIFNLRKVQNTAGCQDFEPASIDSPEARQRGEPIVEVAEFSQNLRRTISRSVMNQPISLGPADFISRVGGHICHEYGGVFVQVDHDRAKKS